MNKEQRINVKFCVKNGISGTKTLWMLKIAYGDNCLSQTQVFEWHRRFREGREDAAKYLLENEPVISGHIIIEINDSQCTCLAFEMDTR
ncbi:Protein GVQW3 [Anthophora retusa]